MLPDFKVEAAALFDNLVDWRREFHRFPELGFQEVETAERVARHLAAAGMHVRSGIGQTGVVGLLEGAHPGPTLMLRFDMDALPITELSESSYASTVPGVMHACGHDGHMAIGVGVARILSRYRSDLHGRIKFVFQPAEEGLGGAFAMIADGVLEDPRPDLALALHLWNDLPYGQVKVTAGPCMAASSRFSLTVKGVGGHGAAPHQGRDPILAAAHMVVAMQSIVSRNIDPQESVVVTVGQFDSGTTFNVIPEQASLKGTVRSYNVELHRVIYRRILEMAKNMATAFGCTTNMETVAIVPAVVNAPEAAELVVRAAAEIVGVENVIAGREMASDDMGYFLEEVPGCYFFVGSANEATGLNRPHHHPRFDFDERALVNAVAVLAQAAAEYLQPAEAHALLQGTDGEGLDASVHVSPYRE